MSWETKSLNNIITFQRGFDLPKSKFKDGTYPVVGSTGIIGYHSQFKVCAPGVVTGRSGTLGVFQYLEEDFWAHNTSLWVKDFQDNNPKFIYYFLHQFDFKNLNGGVAVPTLNRNILSSINVKYPKSLQTQKRIADILSAYDDLIENNLKRIKLLEQAAQNIYKEWFVNLRFPGHENTPINEETGLPEGWEEKTISDVMEYKVDNRGRNPKYYTKSGIPVIDNHLIKNSPHIDFSKTKRYIDDDLFDVFIRRYLKKDDVLITLVGTVANISLAPKEKSVIIQNTIGIRCNEFCTQEYMYCFLGANKTKIQNKNRGAAQPSVKVGDLTGMKMVIPNNELLNNFSKEIKTMFSLIQTLGKQNSQLKAARDILLPRLMNRTIEV